MKQYKFIAITDEVTECGCCGRSDLKCTIVVQDIELSEFFYFGSQCAAKALTWGIKDVNKESKKAHEQYEIEAKKFYHNHPSYILKWKEVENCNNKNLTFLQRPIEKWRQLEKEAKEDTLKKFPFAKKLY